LYVGALSKYKNVEILIRALKILASKRKDIELIIIGDGPEKQRLMDLALRLGVDNKITLKHGLSSDELLQEYAAASAVVLLSTLESFSRVAHEAIAVGTPLIVYNYGPLSALVSEGLAKGVNNLNPAEIANAIDEVLSTEWKKAKPELQLDNVAYVNLITRLYESLL
jgi:glycosyltransferase involved in cell wall biosynthesis